MKAVNILVSVHASLASNDRCCDTIVDFIRGRVAGCRTLQSHTVFWHGRQLTFFINFPSGTSMDDTLFTSVIFAARLACTEASSFSVSPLVTLLSTPLVYVSLEHLTPVDNLRHISYCCCPSFSYLSLALSFISSPMSLQSSLTFSSPSLYPALFLVFFPYTFLHDTQSF